MGEVLEKVLILYTGNPRHKNYLLTKFVLIISLKIAREFGLIIKERAYGTSTVGQRPLPVLPAMFL